MAKELDPYSNCPCGSGKKVRFCCKPFIADMTRAEELRMDRKPAASLAILDSLEKKRELGDWTRAWIKAERAIDLLALNRGPEAEDAINSALSIVPKFPIALAVRAMLQLQNAGYPAARPAVEAAFEHAVDATPQMVAEVAYVTAGLLSGAGHTLAARQHFAFSAVLDPENEERTMTLVEFESSERIPFPLRSNYALHELTVPVALKEVLATAELLSARCCYGRAAVEYNRIATAMKTSAEAWLNVGMCHAWVGQPAEAVSALRAGAQFCSDAEVAIDAEVLAQLLESSFLLPQTAGTARFFQCDSPGRVLSVLDETQRFVRVAPPQELQENPQLAGAFAILDRPAPSFETNPQLTLDDMPRQIATVLVFDGVPAKSVAPRLFVGILPGESVDEITALLTGALGESLTLQPEREEANERSRTVPTEQLPLERLPSIPSSTELPLPQRRQLEKQLVHRVTHDLWPTIPQAALAGKSPLDAAGHADLARPLSAAVVVFESFCATHRYALDADQLRARLRVKPRTELDLEEKDDPSRLSTLQLTRVVLHRVTDMQLTIISNRATRARMRDLVYRSLTECLSRPAMLEKTEQSTIYMTLADLCRIRFQREEALAWLNKGRQLLKGKNAPLQQLLEWEIQELVLRSEDPEDPQAAVIARQISSYYLPKLPEYAQSVMSLLGRLNVPGPWNAAGSSGLVTSVAAAADPAASGVWTPESAAEPQSSGSKLWLPGQS